MTHEDPHEVMLVCGPVMTMWGWKCSCGASSSGQWFKSQEEAWKRAEKHMKGIF